MIRFLRETNIYFKTAIWTILFTLGITVLLIPLFFFKLQEIPFGILLGGLFGSLYYIFAGFNQREEYTKKALVIDVVLLVLRLILFMGALVGLALLYYKVGAHMFNVFAFTGGYLISLLVQIILLKMKGKE